MELIVKKKNALQIDGPASVKFPEKDYVKWQQKTQHYWSRGRKGG